MLHLSDGDMSWNTRLATIMCTTSFWHQRAKSKEKNVFVKKKKRIIKTTIQMKQMRMLGKNHLHLFLFFWSYKSRCTLSAQNAASCLMVYRWWKRQTYTTCAAATRSSGKNTSPIRVFGYFQPRISFFPFLFALLVNRPFFIPQAFIFHCVGLMFY